MTKNLIRRHFLSRFTALLAASSMMQPAILFAQVMPADGSTKVTAAPNGVFVVDIARANAQGLSNNNFTDYNVDPRGLVLNNANKTQISRDSVIAGKVMFNSNLSNEATVILNQVVTSNRSKLEGFTEVLGGQADVIVANPNGITCNGCGFLNTNNVTLTTGTPVITNGQYTGAQVRGGDILIHGNGLNGTYQDYMSLVARSIKVDGVISANDVNMHAGVLDYDAATRTATAASGGTGTTPTYAVDSTALGGIYANAIRLQATDAGVGVRALGDVAATGSDFTINSAGKIELNNRISAERDISITSTSNDAQALKLTNASLTSKRDTALSATGGTVLEGGTILAKRNLAVNAGSLTDTQTSGSGDNNKRRADGTLSMTTTGATTLSDVSYSSAGLMSVIAGSLGFGTNGATLGSESGMNITTNSGDMALGKAAISAEDDLNLTASGAISTGTGGSQAVQSKTGNVSVTSNGLTNAGTITSDAGTLTVRSNGTITNRGMLNSHGTLDVADRTGGTTADVTNSGTMLTAGTLNVKADDLNNSNSMQGSTVNVTANALTNSGTLQSTGAMNLTTQGISNSNKIISAADMTVRGINSSSYNVNNAKRMEAGGKLDIKGFGGGKAVNVTNSASTSVLLGDTVDMNVGTFTIANNTGLTSKGDLTLNADALSMQGSGAFIVASSQSGRNGTGTINVGASDATTTLTVPGLLHSGYNLVVSAPRLETTSTGAISAMNNLTVNATESTNTGNFFNNGAIYAGKLFTANINNIFSNENTGTINSDDDMVITAGSFVNRNDVIGKGDITMNVYTFSNYVPGSDNRVYVYKRLASDTDMTHNFNPNDSTDRTFFYDQDNFTEEMYQMNEDGLGPAFDRTWYYRGTFTATQVYQGGKPTDKPQVIGGTSGAGVFTLNFHAADNIGGVISAPTVTLNGDTGATFYNDNLALKKQNWAFSYNHYYDATNNNGGDRSYRSFTKSVTSTVNKSSDAADNIGAGIFAGTLNGGGFTLTNEGGAKSATTTTRSASGDTSTTITGLTFGGVNVTLPANPNGYFVPSQNATGQFLIETNPRYAGKDALGSDYLAKRYGIDPDNIMRRLGDAGYETTLVRDQLVAQTGTNSLNRGESETQQMQRLMDNGADQGKEMGLKFGQALSAEQVANLKDDMVWMVETEVKGQKVLAPVVYLSAATKAMFQGGEATIAANNINLNLDGMTNNGGTISGANTMAITSKGDINNISGTIKGGDVSLTSTQGSINNITTVQTGRNGAGDITSMVGQTATISSTGNLKLDAKNDITNKGANMAAGGDASLKAGNNITFDTVEDTNRTSTGSSSGIAGINGRSSTTTTTTIKQVKSGLTAGGNLKMDAGNDVTLAGTDVEAGKDVDINAGGNLNVLSRTDTTLTDTRTSATGFGVGGGVYGTEQTTDVHQVGKNVASNIKSGGNTNLNATKNLLIQGSNIDAGGDVGLKGDSVAIVEGRDTDDRVTTRHTTTFLSTDSNSSSDAGARANATAGTDKGKASASASASADASAGGGAGLALSDTTLTKTTSLSSKAVGSTIKSGGNAKIESNNGLLIRGGTVDAGGDVELSGTDVNITAAQDTSSTTTTTERARVGFFAESENKAEAGASAGASADRGGASATGRANNSGAGFGVNAGDASVSAEAKAEAKAGSNNTLDLVQHSKSTTNTTDVTHQASSIKSGGNMKVTATESLKVHGSDIEAGKDLDLSAKDMSFTAAEDSHTTRTDTSTTRTGFYADADAGASAGASGEAKVKGFSAEGEASAEAGTEAGVGLYGKNTTSYSAEGSTTARTSSIKSGGNTTRTAEGKILDVGTQIEAGGDFTQTAKSWDSQAAKDTSYSETGQTSHTARFGLYGEAGAEAKAEGGATGGIGSKPIHTENEAGAEAGASAGLKASYDYDKTGESKKDSTAVVSNIKSGGNFKSTTTEKTTLEGTNIEAGGDAELSAKSLDFKAAKNTSEESSTETKAGGELKVGVDATKAVTGTAAGSYDNTNKSASSTEAVTGGIKSGGNMKVTTTEDARFEGANLEAGGDAKVDAGGNLTFDAARNTSTESENSTNASLAISASKSKGSSGTGNGKNISKGFAAEGGYETGTQTTNDAVTGSIKSGGKMDLSAGKSATFEGTQLESGGDASVTAKDNVNFNAAKSTSTDNSWSAGGKIEATKGAGGSKAGVEIEGKYANSKETTNEVAGIKSGGNLKIDAGKDVNLEGTNIEATDKATLKAGGDVNFKAAEDTSESVEVGASLTAGKVNAKEGATESDLGPSSNGRYTKKKAETTEKEGKKEAGLDFEASYGKSNTKKAGSVKAGSLEIESGKNTTLEGTNIDTKGDTSISAGGDVNFDAAKSSSFDASIGGSVGGEDGALLSDFGVGGEDTRTGSKVNTGGNLNVKSGGKTSFTGTKANVNGKADINAAGGIEENSAVSGGGQIGLTRAGAGIDVQKTNINAGGGVNKH